MSTRHMADLFAKLMIDELGYTCYAAHGTDWGRGVLLQLAFDHPHSLVGIHTGGTLLPVAHSRQPHRGRARVREQPSALEIQETAYTMLHATKPQTLAYGLNDSPTGLAAWIIEKFRAWSDCNGDVEKAFTKMNCSPTSRSTGQLRPSARRSAFTTNQHAHIPEEPC